MARRDANNTEQHYSRGWIAHFSLFPSYLPSGRRLKQALAARFQSNHLDRVRVEFLSVAGTWITG